MGRTASVNRQTRETDINLCLNIDGTGKAAIRTGIPFFDHMLELLARHGLMDLDLQARGDLQVDGHHTVEDVGIVLGTALRQAMGDRQGVNRYGHAVIPMDEALVQVVLDLSGRPYLACELTVPAGRLGDFDTELMEEFLRALTVQAGITLHVRQLAGRNSHHILEAVCKGLGRALREALAIDPRVVGIPSTKGILV